MDKKIISILAILLALVSIVSCRRQSELASDEYRNLLSLKTELRQKEIFKNLSTDSKLELWKSKLEQVAREDISDEQKKLITKISDELSTIKDDNFDGQKLFEYAIRMAQITPEDEFIRMFFKLEIIRETKTLIKDLLQALKKHLLNHILKLI